MSGIKEVVALIQLDLNTKIVVFGQYAEGYYSGVKLFKYVILPTEQYEQFKLDKAFDGVEDYVYDLDGKHSAVESEFTKYTTTVKYFLSYEDDYNSVVNNNFDFSKTNDNWYNELFGENGLYEFNLYDLTNNYIKQLISLKKETVSYQILVKQDRFNEMKKSLIEHFGSDISIIKKQLLFNNGARYKNKKKRGIILMNIAEATDGMLNNVKDVLDLMVGGHFGKRMTLEQILYMSMIGKGDCLYYVMVGDDKGSYVQDFIRLMVNVSGQESVNYLNHNELFTGIHLLRNSDKLVIGSGTVAKTMSEKDDVVLKYLVDGESLYIKPLYPRVDSFTLRFGGVVVQKVDKSSFEEFIGSMSESLKRRVSMIEFVEVDVKERFNFDGDVEFIEELKLYLMERYGQI